MAKYSLRIYVKDKKMRANLRDGSYSLKVGTIPPKSDSYVPTPAAASASIVLDAKSAKLQLIKDWVPGINNVEYTFTASATNSSYWYWISHSKADPDSNGESHVQAKPKYAKPLPIEFGQLYDASLWEVRWANPSDNTEDDAEDNAETTNGATNGASEEKIPFAWVKEGFGITNRSRIRPLIFRTEKGDPDEKRPKVGSTPWKTLGPWVPGIGRIGMVPSTKIFVWFETTGAGADGDLDTGDQSFSIPVEYKGNTTEAELWYWSNGEFTDEDDAPPGVLTEEDA